MTTYNIYRREVGDTNQSVAIATDLTSKNYSDLTGTKGKRYLYSVGAVKNSVEKVSDEKMVLFGEAWTPANLTHAAKLFFIGDSVTIDSSNRVGSMIDQSPSGYNATQTADSNKPLLQSINGVAAVAFDSVDDYLDIASGSQSLLNGVSSWWMFSVFNTTKKTTDNDILAFGGKAKIVQVANSDKISVGGRRLSSDSWSGVASISNVSGLNTICFGQANYSATSLKNYINGTLENQNSSWQTTGVSDTSVSPVRIGANASPAPGVYSNAKIGCVLMGVGVLSDSERQKLEGWAAHKYGLTANLPSGHPYRTLIPTL